MKLKFEIWSDFWLAGSSENFCNFAKVFEHAFSCFNWQKKNRASVDFSRKKRKNISEKTVILFI